MSPSEAVREIADLQKRVQRLEDALEGLLLLRPRLLAGLGAPDEPVARREAVRAMTEAERLPQGDAWPPGSTFGGWR
jgi:hypothetical protein